MKDKGKFTYSNISEADLRKALDELTLPKDSNRPFILYSGCKTYGWVKWDSTSLDIEMCNSPDCTNCRHFEKALLDESNKYKINEKKT